MNKGCDPSGNGEGPQERERRERILWRRETSMLNQCEKEQSHELAGIHLAIIRKDSYNLERSGIAH